MQKFLIVGCGGSGGATLRYIMDQLRADLRSHGIESIPPAWQFLHIDTNPEPEETPGLGNIRDLGGHYLSVSSPGNSYSLVANQVEGALGNAGVLRGLLGWAPSPKESASYVGVVKGAGQYRAVGRMLTLTDLSDIRAAMQQAWVRLQAPDAWGDLTGRYPERTEPDAGVIPMVIGSMAGGSGASMFLDVCRLLGRVPGLSRSELGVFLYTADVFSALPAAERTGVDGNALGAIGEIMAAQTRASDACDTELFSALGVAPEALDQAAFARVFPIGLSIGGDGARFGDGSPGGVFRGLGRAIAATMSSDSATEQYVKSKVENPTPPTMNRDVLGWGADASVFSWGSFGYASLSLGRDRYAEYASQRLARVAVDRLVGGHLNPHVQLPASEQLNSLVDAQFPAILQSLGFPDRGTDIRSWFVDRALTETTLAAGAQAAASDAIADLGSVESGQAAAWLEAVRARLTFFQPAAAARTRDDAYLWANNWARTLEAAVHEEFLRATTLRGLEYAVAIVKRLRSHLNPVIEALRGAPPATEVLKLDNEATTRAIALKKSIVGAGHAVSDLIARGFVSSARSALESEAARIGAEVLASYAEDVLGALERTGVRALQDLRAARESVVSASGGAGLAQLATTSYLEWPTDSREVPKRFDQADNEVLLTTSEDFPEQFERDVTESVPGAGGVFDTAKAHVVGEIIAGRWQSLQGVKSDFDVLTTQVAWRPAALRTDPITQTPTPRSIPVYRIAVLGAEVLDRARTHLSRPDMPFERFSEQTIEEYLTDPAQADSVLDTRAHELVTRFREAMALARPLVGVNPPMIQALHPGHSLIYQYSFSTIPVSPSSPVAQRLHTMLTGDATLDSTTADRFQKALSDQAQANRIAIFGSYPKYSPLVFSSLLDQIDKRWTSAPEIALSDLWQWKRTRPLPASLAMGAAEQRAIVTGWWLARMLGMLAVPADARTTDPVQVFDPDRHDWLSFPGRLLTPPTAFRGPDDWLPAVLESHSLALVRCNGDVTLSALQPYIALRRIADNNSLEPQGGYGGTSGRRLLAAWIGSGTWPSGQASPVLPAEVVSGPGVTPEQRAEAATTWLQAVATYVGETYLTAGQGVGALAVRRPDIPNLAALAAAPMFAEVAQLCHDVLNDLIAQVAEALIEARPAAGFGGSDVNRPVM